MDPIIYKIKLLPALKFLFVYVFIVVVVYTIKGFMQLWGSDLYSFATLWFATGIVIKVVLFLFFGTALTMFKEINFIKEDAGLRYRYGIETVLKEEPNEKGTTD